MFRTPSARALGVVVLLLVLAVLFVAHGATGYDPERNHYPDEKQLVEDYDAYVGERVDLSGAVVGVDPIVIDAETPEGDPFELRIENVDEPVSEGERLSVFGTVEPDRTIEAERTLVREPWEITYMYGISLLAGLWVLARFVREWRIDTGEWAFVPRDEPLRLREDG